MVSVFSLILGLVTTVAGTNSQLRSGHGGMAHSFIRTLEFKQSLRVCNAYPYNAALDVWKGKTKLTETGTLGYKQCGSFTPTLQAGEKIDFKVGDSTVGTFTISDLPQSDAVLLMVIFRHDTLSTAVSFESHVFANSMQAQVAVIDTYKGKSNSELRIQDREKAKSPRSEILRYESVVAVTPGVYDVVLRNSAGEEQASDQLVAQQHESYVVLRCGVEAQQGQAYPQEILVYPRSDPAQFQKSLAQSFNAKGWIAIVALFVAALK